jgi:hypothetical protein
MARKANSHKPMILCLVWIAVIGILTLPGSAAAESGNAGTAIRDITPMTEIGAHGANMKNPEDYFDIVGILNVLENDRIVVGNSELKPASGLKTSHMELSNIVGVKVNKSGEVVKIETIYNDPH